jgi:hypothetical protein
MAPAVVVEHSIPTNCLITMLQMSISTFDGCGMFEMFEMFVDHVGKISNMFHAHDLHTGNMLICILFDKRPQCALTSACFFLEKNRELSTKTEQMRSSDAFCKLMENGVPRFFVADLFPQNKWREFKTVSSSHCAKTQTEHCVASLFKQLKRSSPFCFVTQDQETIGKKTVPEVKVCLHPVHF